MLDHVSESEKDSEEEILVTTSELESETKDEAGEDSGPGSDWEMEDTEANQDSMSAYEFTDDET